MNKYAIIMGGGKGTRMKSDLPKVLHELLGEPFLAHSIATLKQAGAERVITITGYRHDLVEEVMKGQCEFAVQEPQLGTGHAVMQAHQLENEEGITIVANGDCPTVTKETYEKLYAMMESENAEMAVLTAVPDDSAAYGRVIRRADGTVEKIVEFKDADEQEKAVREINTGIYAFDNKSLFEVLKLIKNNNANHEYYITDLVEILQSLGKKVIAVACEDFMEAAGMNDCVEQATVEAYLRDRINHKWMKEGVTIHDPKNTWIGPFAEFGHDVVIYPGTHIFGHSKIGSHVTLLPGVYGENVTIADNTVVEPYTVIRKNQEK